MRKWYQIQMRAVAAKADKPAEIVAEVDLLDEIGFWGVTAKDFLDELKVKAVGATSMKMSINSPGGSVFDGLAIYHGIKALGIPVNVKVLGIAASAASLIAMAGTTISMPENTFMMIHNPWGVVVGNADEMRNTADDLDKIGGSLFNVYSVRTKLPDEELKAMLGKDTYMTAAEAKEKGFADEVLPEVSAKASFEMDQLPKTVRAAFTAAQKAPPEPVKNVPLNLVASIEAAATEGGFPEFAASWALDDEIVSAADPMVALGERIAAAKETKALCALCKAPAEVVSAFIAQKTPMADVRKKLIDSKASADESYDIDTALKITKPGDLPKPMAAKAIIDTDSVYAARKPKA